ncbi:UPF0223 family protein [Anaerobacillus alkaliphilus]|uniref:UPF0223 family protein n=1 Tax=Anaerobacillus alkaliphilus TaxID=1548597 RepID=A0A4Q0VQC7_9BACI|nr:UPF0223 family protein [Anaerobacillus alkaliphilus]RXI98155.1 UPF0223 family protein [Anaerobacillus alkaliphilus]
MDINIPISLDWTKEEVIDVVQFFQGIEEAYGKGIDKARMLDLYKRFKVIVPSKSEEKQLFREFDEQSNYICYNVVKEALNKESAKTKIKLGR